MHTDPGPLRWTSRVLVAFAAPVLAITLASSSTAAPAPAAPARDAVGSVTVRHSTVSVPVSGAYSLEVITRLTADVPYMQVRMQMRHPSGKLIVQRTQTYSRVTSDVVATGFSRGLSDLGLRPGRYPVEIRVRARLRSGAVTETVVDDRLLVYAPGGSLVPVAIVVRIGCSPGIAPDGRFADDPARTTASRDAAVALADMVLRRPEFRLTAALTPEMLEEWQRIAAGYETAGPEGVRRVARGEPVPRAYAAALERLRAAVATGRMELLDVPYADPDLPALASVGSIDALGSHYSRGLSVYLGALDATPSPGTAVTGDVFPRSALAALRSRDLRYVIVRARSLARPSGVAPGPHRISDTTMTALVADEQLGSLAGEAEATPTAAIDRVFERLLSQTPASPVVAVVEVGPGRTATMVQVERFLGEVSASGWSRPLLAAEAARLRAGVPSVRLAERPTTGKRAPEGYWQSAAVGRRKAEALSFAVGPSDRDAEAASWSAMLSESRCWAGPDESWSLAHRGQAFATAAGKLADGVFGKVRLGLEDITLSGKSGKIPVAVVNGSGKTLHLMLRATGEKLEVRPGPEIPVTAGPAESLTTLDVDLRGAISDLLAVTLDAGDLRVASATATVRASVLDRLALVAVVVAMLLGLLVFIRRRLSAAQADAARIDAGATAQHRADRRSGRTRVDRG